MSKPASAAVTAPPSAVNGTGKEGAANSSTGLAGAASARAEQAIAKVSAATKAATQTNIPRSSLTDIPVRDDLGFQPSSAEVASGSGVVVGASGRPRPARGRARMALRDVDEVRGGVVAEQAARAQLDVGKAP